MCSFALVFHDASMKTQVDFPETPESGWCCSGSLSSVLPSGTDTFKQNTKVLEEQIWVTSNEMATTIIIKTVMDSLLHRSHYTFTSQSHTAKITHTTGCWNICAQENKFEINPCFVSFHCETYDTPCEYSCDTVEQMDDVKRPAHWGLDDVTTDGREEEDLGEYIREHGRED